MIKEELLAAALKKMPAEYGEAERAVYTFGVNVAMELMWDEVLATYEDKEITKSKKMSLSDLYNAYADVLYTQPGPPPPNPVVGQQVTTAGHAHITNNALLGLAELPIRNRP